MAGRGFSMREWIDQAEKSENFDSYKLYIIELHNDNERFIKVGRTFNTVEKRFSADGSLPYCYDVLKIVEDTPYRIFNLETKLKRKFKQHRYKPLKSFSGLNECFTLEIKEFIQDIK